MRHEPVPCKHRVPARTTEEERPIGRVFFHGRPQPIHPFAAGDSLLQFGKVKSSVSPGDLPEIDGVLDANIVEGNESLFGDSLANAGVISQVVIKDGRNVDAVGTFRSRGQTKCKVTVKFREHATVARCMRMVHLVHDHIVKVLVRESLKAFRSREFLDRRDDQFAGQVTLIADIPRG